MKAKLVLICDSGPLLNRTVDAIDNYTDSHLVLNGEPTENDYMQLIELSRAYDLDLCTIMDQGYFVLVTETDYLVTIKKLNVKLKLELNENNDYC